MQGKQPICHTIAPDLFNYLVILSKTLKIESNRGTIILLRGMGDPKEVSQHSKPVRRRGSWNADFLGYASGNLKISCSFEFKCLGLPQFSYLHPSNTAEREERQAYLGSSSQQPALKAQEDSRGTRPGSPIYMMTQEVGWGKGGRIKGWEWRNLGVPGLAHSDLNSTPMSTVETIGLLHFIAYHVAETPSSHEPSYSLLHTYLSLLQCTSFNRA